MTPPFPLLGDKMPIYQYRCPDGHLIEEIFSISGYMSEVPCICGQTAKRIFTPPAIHGITFTDFRKEYLAHQDKYPDAESNIKFCEAVTGKSRNDPELTHLPKARRPKWQ